MTTHGPTTGDLMTTNDVPADTGDVDALAVLLWKRECRYADSPYDESPEVRDGFRDDAKFILASDWLAARDAAQRADERERIAQAIEAMPIHNGYSGHWLNGWLQSKGEAANIARAGTAVGSDAIHEPRCNTHCTPGAHHLTSGVGYPHLHRTDLANECGECVTRTAAGGDGR